MACRIQNTGRHLLCIDLRDGESIHLRPGEISSALREELLYDNPYLSEMESQGLARRLHARMSDVLAAEAEQPAQVAGVAAPLPATAPKKGRKKKGKRK